QQFQMREGFMEELLARQNSCTADELLGFGAMLEMMPPDAKEKLQEQFGPLAVRQVPKFHLQFPKQCGL
ncbi:ABHD17A, partial [Symbiodinium sp. CCMP2456]